MRIRMLNPLCALLMVGAVAVVGPAPAAHARPATAHAVAGGVTTNALIYDVIWNLDVGQCIDTPKRQVNELLRLADCNYGDTQLWALLPGTQPGILTFVNKATNLCIEVNNGTSVPGEWLDAWYCDGLSSEQWVAMNPAGLNPPWHMFEHVGTGLCLDTVSGVNSAIMQWYCDPGNRMQTWFYRGAL